VTTARTGSASTRAAGAKSLLSHVSPERKSAGAIERRSRELEKRVLYVTPVAQAGDPVSDTLAAQFCRLARLPGAEAFRYQDSACGDSSLFRAAGCIQLLVHKAATILERQGY
jgi:hypothetical protein